MTTIPFPKLSADQRLRLLEPPNGKVRLVIDTDAHNEIDDQFALVWALLSLDKFNIEGVYAAPYSFAHHREPLLEVFQSIKSGRAGQIDEKMEKYRSWVRRLI